MALPFAFHTAFCNKQNVFDGSRDGDASAKFEPAGHRPPRLHPVVSVAGHSGDIVREKHTTFLGGPIQDCGVIVSRQPRVLNAEEVQLRRLTPQPAQDVVVEVFVKGKRQHDSSAPTASGQQTFTDALRIESALVFPAHVVGLSAPLLQVGLNALRLAEIITDGRIHVCERDRGVLLCDLLGQWPPPETQLQLCPT